MNLPLKLIGNNWQYTTIYDANDVPICQLDLEDWGVTEENQDELEVRQAEIAGRIVRTVNAHAELVAALEAVHAYLQTGKWEQEDGVDNVIRAALAKAKEVEP